MFAAMRLASSFVSSLPLIAVRFQRLAGNENLEIQWRLATLSEAKAVVSHYHKHLSENGLIKSIPELSASSFSVKRELSYRPTNGGSEAVSQPT
jgi:hypothetical protein